ncbi:MAG TPA: hypothetical protein VLS45_02920 [Methylomicrobium sp.]|nr:hypothetical protein [Methylomicrobium sp.]
MQDRLGKEISIGDRVVHFQKDSTYVRIQIGHVTELNEEYRRDYWSTPGALKLNREWTNSFQEIGVNTPWIDSRNVIVINP